MSIKKIYYNQMDNRWVNYPYPAPGYENATVGSSGCAPTCAAMIVSSAKETIYPNQMADISRENGYRVSGGTDAGLFPYVAQRWGLEYKTLKSSYEAFDACQNNWFVVILCGAGLWTTSGHYILAVGTRNDEIEIYDPYLYDGKFNKNGRKGKVSVEGVSCFVQIDTFKAYSEARSFYAFKIPEPVQPDLPNISIENYTDMDLYAEMYVDLRNAFGRNEKKLREHFNTWGINEKRIASYVFDKDVYLGMYEDIRKNIGGNSVALYEHFSTNGIKEKRIGGILYDPDLYYNLYKDIQSVFGQRWGYILKHFLSNGMKENRIASYVFDPIYYYNKYEDLRKNKDYKNVKKDGKILFRHFLANGIREGRVGSQLFDVKYYKEKNKDLQKMSNYEATIHFVTNGIKEGRVASKEFDVRKYRELNQDLDKAFGNDWKAYYKHYLVFGKKEGRKCI